MYIYMVCATQPNLILILTCVRFVTDSTAGLMPCVGLHGEQVWQCRAVSVANTSVRSFDCLVCH